MGVTRQSGENTAYLTGIRGFAALLVVFGHCSNFGMHLLVWIELTHTAKSGVWLFFVLSAYLLTPRLLKSAARDGWRRALAHYALKRGLRILPLYYLTLAALLTFGIIGGGEFLAHVALVRGNFHFWTIPVEMTFYAVLPALLFALSRFDIRIWAPLLWLGALFLYVAADPSRIESNTLNLANFMIFFVSGMVLSLAPRGRLPARLATPVVVISLAAIPLLFPANLSRWFGTDGLSLAVLFVVPWVALIYAGETSPFARRLFGSAPLRLAGEVSFSLYLCHFFIIAAVGKVLSGPLAGWVALTISLAAASVSWYLVEKRGTAVLESVFHRLAPLTFAPNSGIDRKSARTKAA